MQAEVLRDGYEATAMSHNILGETLSCSTMPYWDQTEHLERFGVDANSSLSTTRISKSFFLFTKPGTK